MADGASTAGTSSAQVAGDSPELTVEINIKTLDSKTYTFRVNKDMPVLALKKKLVDVSGVPLERQRLIFRGKVLKDDHPLSEYHLEDGHTLHLVARQPVEGQVPSGTSSEGTTQDNVNQGCQNHYLILHFFPPHGTIATLVRFMPACMPHSYALCEKHRQYVEGHAFSSGGPGNRVGQVSHGVLLGTVNVADQGESMVTDIGQIVGAVLSSLGVGSGAPIGLASGQPSTATTNQDPPSAEAGGNQNTPSSHVAGNSLSPALTMLNHPFFQQIPQLPLTGLLSPHMTIPDSLTTLSEFMNHMQLALQNSGFQPSTDNARQPLRTETQSPGARGLPTLEMLRMVVEQAEQLLRINAGAALSQFAVRLERDGTSTDTVVRNRVQAEAMHVGSAMQHLGAMFLELGRTIMTLRMGQSPPDSVVNAGPAVYISPSGPNPIMVQPFPLQANSMFGVSRHPLVTGVSGSPPTGEPSRNINIHIHAGGPLIPGASNPQQTSRDGNRAGDSVPTRGLPSRTIVAAIPASPITQTSGNVHSIIYPVHVRSQLSVPIHSASAQVSNQTVSSGAQTWTIPVPQSSSGSGTLPTFVAQISAQVVNALSGAAHSSGSFSQNNESTDAQRSQAQSGVGRQGNQTSSEDHVLSVNAEGRFSPNVQSNSSSLGGPQQVPSDLSPEDVNDSAGNLDVAGRGNTVSAITIAHGTSVPTTEGQKFSQERTQRSNDSDNVSTAGGFAIDVNSSAATSAGVSTVCQDNDEVSNERSYESMSDSVASNHTSELGSSSDRATPLGLGLGGLQPKRMGKTVKPVGKDKVSRGTLSANEEQQSITRGQQFLRSLVSQSSDVDSAITNVPSKPQNSLIGQIMDGLPLGRQGANTQGQVNASDMMSQILQTPTFKNILTGVAEQTGIGSSDGLRSMLEQCAQSSAVRNTLNNIVQQVEGQPETAGDLFSGTGMGQGGLDFSRMIQQMLPAVSQALGRSSSPPIPTLSVQPNFPTQSDEGNGRSRRDDTQHEISSLAELDRAVEMIELHDSPGNVFRAVAESAGNLVEEGNGVGDIVNTIGNNEALANEFMRMLSRDLQRRSQTDSTSEE